MNFKEEAAALQPYIVEQRRWLHQHPELTFREKIQRNILKTN